MAADAGSVAARSGSVLVVVTGVTPLGSASARSRRARSSRVKAGSGSTGRPGSCRSVNGSRMAVLPSVVDVVRTERRARPNEQRLGGMKGAPEDGGDLRDRKVIDITEGECESVLRRQGGEGLSSAHRIQVGVPRVLDRGRPRRILGHGL